MTKVLFVSSEVYPLSKTGGLGDVAASLPTALSRAGVDIRILVPAYPVSLRLAQEHGLVEIASLTIDNQLVKLHETLLPGTSVPVWLVDIPAFSEREGNFYCGPDGKDWPDNADRFYLFCRVAEALALKRTPLSWVPDIVHGNDWQSGLIAPLLTEHPDRPITVFTIHNLAYRGEFSRLDFDRLSMPESWWSPAKLEFFDKIAFIKGGLLYSDKITTVSPNYAREIQTPEFGWGLESLLTARHENLEGILNGIDDQEWNPATDPWLIKTYSRFNISDKAVNKHAMQERFGLEVDDNIPVLGFVGRMVHQKGIDLILQSLPTLLKKRQCQLIALGNGEARYEKALKKLARQFPGQVSMTAGYSEEMAHIIEAGSDIFLMPSAFEPCGLNQMYSLRYGTVPVVHGVGGLRDSIVHFDGTNADQATGFMFAKFTAYDFNHALQQAIYTYHSPALWKQLQRNGMATDLSWKQSAQRYLTMYEQLVRTRRADYLKPFKAVTFKSHTLKGAPLRKKVPVVVQPARRELRMESPPLAIR